MMVCLLICIVNSKGIAQIQFEEVLPTIYAPQVIGEFAWEADGSCSHHCRFVRVNMYINKINNNTPK